MGSSRVMVSAQPPAFISCRSLTVSDGNTDLVKGVVDIASGYAMIATATGCKAWNYVKVCLPHCSSRSGAQAEAVQRTNASPTCYTFPAGSDSSSYSRSSHPVLADFFTGSGAEPGVVIVSPDGEIRVWENMSLGLGNLDRFQSAKLELGQDDLVDSLWKLDVRLSESSQRRRA